MAQINRMTCFVLIRK